MKNKPLTIALVGSGLPLSVCAAFLAEKLQYLNPAILAIQLPSDGNESHLSFAFPPFAEPVLPILRSRTSETSLQKINIVTPASPSGFAFNFSPYGVVSDAITFHHAYQICHQHEAVVAAYDSFLAVKPPPSPGVVYIRQHFTAEYQQSAVKRGVIYVPSERVSVALADDAEKILSVETSTRQRIAADYFIDCSSTGIVMEHLQKKVSVSEKIVPPWSVMHHHHKHGGAMTAVELKFEKTQVRCLGDFCGERREKTYRFGSSGTLCEHFERPWLGNCVAMGSSFAKIPELVVDRDRVLERQLVALSWLLGASSETFYSARHFNMLSMRDLDEAIDMVNLLIHPSLDQPLELTISNQQRVALFRSSASTIKEDNSLISENCWTGLLHAVGYTPRNTNAVSAATDPQRIIDRTKSLLSR